MQSSLEGIKVIENNPHIDKRGEFWRLFDLNEEMFWRPIEQLQVSLVSNTLKGTLRGMHYQTGMSAESKLVYCISGSVCDVVVDLRKESKTYLSWEAFNIGPAEPYIGLLIPSGFAHGYLTYENTSNMLYFIDRKYDSNSSQGFRWNDNIFSIEWPMVPKVVSQRDANFPDFVP